MKLIEIYHYRSTHTFERYSKSLIMFKKFLKKKIITIAFWAGIEILQFLFLESLKSREEASECVINVRGI